MHEIWGAMKKAADRTVLELGGLDIAVANAGIASWSPFEDMKEQQWKDVIDVNLTGVANTAWAVLPQMKKQQSGSIITVTSIGGRQGGPGSGQLCLYQMGGHRVDQNLIIRIWQVQHSRKCPRPNSGEYPDVP